MKIGIQVLEFEAVGKSTTYLIEEALERGCKVFVYLVKTLSILDGRTFALGRYVQECCEGEIVFHEKEAELNLRTLTLILMRNDPPFNMDYITASYILERSGTLVINSPVAVRNFPEKFVDYYSDTLPTLISQEMRSIKHFIEQYKEVVVKPLYGFAGNDIVKITDATESNFTEIQKLIAKTGTSVVVQQYEKSILENGDKRVVILNGGLLGCLKRTNQENFITNLAQGGTFSSCSLTPAEEERCYRIAADLKKAGIILAGIDLIAEKVSEINVTSVACIKELNQLYHINTAAQCLDVFEDLVCFHGN